jgi:hypothetical protein
MYPHRIRLRGPWDFEPQGAGAPPPGRLLFPAAWPDARLGDWSGRVVLRRKFGYPGRIDAHERVWLVGESVSGPAEVRLAGQALGLVTCDCFAFDVTRLLAQRNLLEIELDVGPERTRLWDDIALEVRATAYLEDIRVITDAQRRFVEGRVTGSADRPLEVYVLASGRSCGYEVVEAGKPFRVGLDDVPGDVRVELVHVSTVWYVVELPS